MWITRSEHIKILCENATLQKEVFWLQREVARLEDELARKTQQLLESRNAPAISESIFEEDEAEVERMRSVLRGFIDPPEGLQGVPELPQSVDRRYAGSSEEVDA